MDFAKSKKTFTVNINSITPDDNLIRHTNVLPCGAKMYSNIWVSNSILPSRTKQRASVEQKSRSRASYFVHSSALSEKFDISGKKGI